MLGVADPFSLATTSVARASAVGLEELERLEPLEEQENQRLEGCRNDVTALFLSKHQKDTHPKAPQKHRKAPEMPPKNTKKITEKHRKPRRKMK